MEVQIDLYKITVPISRVVSILIKIVAGFFAGDGGI